GHESTLLALYNSVHHFGGIVVSPGFTDPAKFTDGNPYGTSHADGQGTNPVDDTTRTAARIQAERVVTMAAKLKAAAESDFHTEAEFPAQAEPRARAESAAEAAPRTAQEGPRRWWERRR
ncbi:hypothetical protein AB0P01_32895, partial [Streptomyces nigra]